MNIDLEFTYDLNYKDNNGKDREFDGFKAKVPASVGDHILWHSCELRVTKVIHFVHGQHPTLICEV
jgi:hypothetical protein